MRRGEKRSATSRRGRTRHKNCHNAFRGKADFLRLVVFLGDNHIALLVEQTSAILSR